MSDAAQALGDLAGQEGSHAQLLEPEERQRAANVVAGHVALAWSLGLVDPQGEVSIFDTDSAWSLSDLDARYSPLATHQVAMLDTLLAGPIAHELLGETQERALDGTLTRAIVLATRLLLDARTNPATGLGQLTLPTNRVDTDRTPPLGVGIRAPGTTLDREVEALLDERARVVHERLELMTPQLRQLAVHLMEEETVSVKTLLALLEPEAI